MRERLLLILEHFAVCLALIVVASVVMWIFAVAMKFLIVPAFKYAFSGIV